MAIGYLVGGIPYALSGFIWGGVLRTVAVHHGTFCVNSIAHIFGTQPYDDTNTSRDSWWVAFITFGEGYHNFHHIFQADYRNGIRWWQWDPSKWWIGAWSLVKFNSNLKRTPKSSIKTAKMRTSFSKIANQSEQNHNENTMNIFESRSDECILAMRDSVRYLDEKRVQLRKTSSTARKIIIGQIAQTKDKIITINKEFQTLLDEMMSPSIHATV
jgi:stearoyl-CoA desaturase (delta-9 desaturase)